MHSEYAEKDAESFWAEVLPQLKHSAPADFTGWRFPRFLPELTLNWYVSETVTFHDSVFLSDAVFAKVYFPAGADFSGATFFGKADFSSAHFAKTVNFTYDRFLGDTTFESTQFEGDANFSKAIFKNTLTFRSATIVGVAIFDQSVFDGFANFGGAKFEGGFLCHQSTCSDVAYFFGAIFDGRTSFLQVRFLGKPLRPQISLQSWFDFCNFGHCTFGKFAEFSEMEFPKFASFQYTDLEHVAFSSINLEHCSFSHSSNLDKAEFIAARWGTRAGAFGLTTRCSIADELIARSGIKLHSGDNISPIDRYAAADRVYRALRMSYEARRDHPRVSDFYFGEMEMRRLAMPSWFRRNIGSLYALYSTFSCYGEQWPRALGWFSVIWMTCAVLYLLCGLALKDLGGATGSPARVLLSSPASSTQTTAGGPTQLSVGSVAGDFGHALIHSFLVGTLVGRDIYAQPINWVGVVVQTAETIIGPLLLGLMALAIRRRFQR